MQKTIDGKALYAEQIGKLKPGEHFTFDMRKSNTWKEQAAFLGRAKATARLQHRIYGQSKRIHGRNQVRAFQQGESNMTVLREAA